MAAQEQEIRIYHTRDGKRPYTQWFDKLRDRTSQQRIDARLGRVQLGNFGDAKAVGRGVIELRIDYGPGYRVYFGRDGEEVVLLLMGGDKRSQSKDIAKAQEYWADYNVRKTE
jgi:putative addiction module killer protein